MPAKFSATAPPTDDKYAADTYCGETDGKRIARAWMYRDIAGHCRDRLLNGFDSLPDGIAVVLCGPVAADVKILINVFGWKPANILAIDLIKENLSVASALGARTFHGDVTDVLRTLDEPIAFLNLDLMGRLSASTSALVASARRLMSADSIVSVTFMRGRERREELDRISRWSKGNEIETSQPGKFNRDYAMLRLLFKVLSPDEWDPMSAVQYQSTCPMSVVAVRRRPARNWEEFPFRFRSVRPGASVREYMLRILAMGPSEEERAIAEAVGADAYDFVRESWTDLLNLSPATVAAWRAHATRGTYGGAKAAR